MRGDHLPHDDPEERGAGDRSAIAALRETGVDTGRPRDIAHSLRFPDHDAARRATEQVRGPGRTMVVGPLDDAKGCPLVVFVHHELTLEAIEALRIEFESASAAEGGRYEGWSLPGQLIEGEPDR
jgi:hypothetical protein